MSNPLSFQTSQFQQLGNDFYSITMPTPLNNPYWVARNDTLLAEQGFAHVDYELLLAYLSGSATNYQPPPLASVYSGHQFGVYVGQLGDGRALLIGDNIDQYNQRWEWQLKGAGLTPYSRFADGRAVLRSSIREYLCSEAMHALGIPTTRAVALIGSKDPVYREQVETSAVLTRLSPTFVRFGHFEHFYHRHQPEQVRQLADWLIIHHFPQCAQAQNPYACLFEHVATTTAELVAKWQSVGFCHGVLNTDNMSILGLTIDYGPFGFIDDFSRDFICNTSDTQGRYSYRQQPAVVHWNLSALATTLQDLVDRATLIDTLNRYIEHYTEAYYANMRAKLGLKSEQEDDINLIDGLLNLMHKYHVDFTLLFRRLSQLDETIGANIEQNLLELWPSADEFIVWCAHYRQRLAKEVNAQISHIQGERERASKRQALASDRQAMMNSVNPQYVLRNYLLQEAIAAAEQGDFQMIDDLHTCLQNPFTQQQQFNHFAALPPEWAKSIRVSCSS